MSSKKLVATLAVLAATALAPATVAQAAETPAPKRPAPVLTPGTQVGSEGIIAILIGVHEPTKQEFPNLVTQQSRAR